MAKRRSRKSSLAQQVVEVAAMGAGAPAPVRRAVSTRWGARLALLAAVGLFVSGVVTVRWTDNRPHLEVNRERAKEVKDAIVERVEKVTIEKADRRDGPRLLDRQSNY
jgi:hypothetical protein